MVHFYRTPLALRGLSRHLLWKISTSSKEIFLTFDDGPIPGLTEYVLDQLKEFEAEATFFCVGDNVRKYPEIFKKIVRKGHAVGNHTFNHLKAWSVNKKTYIENVEKCSDIINNMTDNEEASLFRPPHGQISPLMVKAIAQKYQIVMWDVLTYDFDQNHSPEKSLAKSIDKTRPGSIVVFHDNYKAEVKLKFILPRYLRHFSEMGYKFKKLPPA